MAKKNKKGGKNTNNSAPGAASTSQCSGGSARPANQAGPSKQNVPANQAGPSKQNVPVNQGGAAKQNIQGSSSKQNVSANQAGPSKQNGPVKQTGASKQNGPVKQTSKETVNKQNKSSSKNVIKKKAPPPKSTKPPPKDLKHLPAPKSTHAPAEFRLKCILLFKQEYPMFYHDNVKTPPVNFYYKFSTTKDRKAPAEMAIFNCVDQLVAQDKKDTILTTITSVLDNSNPLLINYDIVLYVLAKCLQLVQQDPKAKLPSTAIIEFRTKVLELAVDRVAGQNSERFLMFVLYMLNFSPKSLRPDAVRKQLQKWYMGKESDQLVVLVAKCSVYQGLSHANVLKLIHFDVFHQSPDKKLALYAIAFGFAYVSHRLISGKFLATPRVPPFVTSDDCFDKASDKVKTIVKDVAVVRCNTSHQKVVAAAVKTHSLGIESVCPKFAKSFKVNTACLEGMTQRGLLQSMHRLRKDNVLSSEDHAIVDESTTCGTYVKQLGASPVTEPPLHPAEVLAAYAEYVLAPETKMASFQKKAVKPPPSEGGGGDQAQEKSEDETPILTAKAPEPAIVSALQELYKSSFSNLKTHDSLKISVCLDLQPRFESQPCRDYRPLSGSHVAVLVLESLLRMVDYKMDNIRLVGFKDAKVRPIVRLKTHNCGTKVESKAEAEEDENDGDDNLEGLDDLVDELATVKLEDAPEAEKEEESGKDSADSIIKNYEKIWRYYKRQIPKARGITIHKLLSWSIKQMWHPDVYVVICSQENLSLYKTNVIFAEYMEKTKRKNTKLIVISPCSHLKSCRVVHRANMLHIVGFDSRISHVIEDFLSGKI
ncbi:hypothetical protein M8J76_002102 [Diaphorina citri]|nr:hypothetical protein M8J75_003569 [Diaphorina citri]KAI5721994.1 hypothetical protein M8J76_002102 [Diaphorina citri]